MPLSIVVKKKHAAERGQHYGLDHYDLVIKKDADVFIEDPDGSLRLLLKFRKNVLGESHREAGDILVQLAKKSKTDNRGVASGHSTKGSTRTKRLKKDGTITKFSYGTGVYSGIAGYFDKLRPDQRKHIKGYGGYVCRTTSFTMKNQDKWIKSIPLIEKVDQLFRELVPLHHWKQHQHIKTKPAFQIGDTAFSTITANYNFRTACHQDAGDFPDGFGNIAVLGRDYTGGYTGFPEYGVCVDIRPMDAALMDVHEWHCNTELYPDESKQGYRTSIVCYMREGIMKCPNDKPLAEWFKDKPKIKPKPEPNFHDPLSLPKYECAEPKYNPPLIDDFYIAIPTLSRCESICDKTLALLNRHGVDWSRVYVFVVKEELDEYTKAIPHPLNFVVAPRGIKQIRNFMSDYFPLGQQLLFMDDDIQRLIVKNTNPDFKSASGKMLADTPFNWDFNGFIALMFNRCRKYGAKMWGVYPVANGYFMKPAVADGPSFIIGSFYGVINCRRYVHIDTKEDIEQSLLYYKADGHLLRCNFVSFISKCFKNKGGCQLTRTPEQERFNANWLAKTYADVCDLSVYVKKGNRTEVRFRRTKRNQGLVTQYTVRL